MGIWVSSSRQVSQCIILQYAVQLLTFLVVDHFTVVVFEHLRVGDTGVSDIAGHVGVCATLIGDDLEEGGASRSWSTEYKDHLTWLQDPGVPGKKIRRKEEYCPCGRPTCE